MSARRDSCIARGADEFNDLTKTERPDPDKSNKQQIKGYGKSKAPSGWDQFRNSIRYNPIVQGIQQTWKCVTIPLSACYWTSSQTKSKKSQGINDENETDQDKQNDIQMANAKTENDEDDYDEKDQDLMNTNDGGIDKIDQDNGMNNDDKIDQDKINGGKNKNVKKMEIEHNHNKMRNGQIENGKLDNDQDDYDENDQNQMNNNACMNDADSNDVQMGNNNMNHTEMNGDYNNKIKPLLSIEDRRKLENYEELKKFRIRQHNKARRTIKRGAVILCIISKYLNKSDNIDGNKFLKEQFIDLFQNHYKYKVFYPNKDFLTGEEAKTFLKETKVKIINDGCYDGVMVILAGHGRSHGLVCSDDTKKVPSLLLFEDDLFDTFSGDTFMVGKPKIFWIDCCLGTEISKTKNIDGKAFEYKDTGKYVKLGPGGVDKFKSKNRYVGHRTDFLMQWSTLKGYVSFGFGETGRSVMSHALHLELKLGLNTDCLTITNICDNINEYVNDNIGVIQNSHYDNHITGSIKIKPNIDDKDKIY